MITPCSCNLVHRTWNGRRLRSGPCLEARAALGCHVFRVCLAVLARRECLRHSGEACSCVQINRRNPHGNSEVGPCLAAQGRLGLRELHAGRERRPCQQRRQVQPLPVSPSRPLRLLRRVCRPCRASQQLLRRITEISATNNRQRKAVNARTSRSNTTSVIGAPHIRLAAHSLYSREQRSPGAPGAPSLPFKPSLPWAPWLPGTPFLPAGPG